MKPTIYLAVIGSVFYLSGCADGLYKPYTVDDRWGQSEKQILKASIADPQSAENPPTETPRKMDGYAGVNTIRTYRNSFGQDNQPQGLTINIGGSSAGGSSGSSGGQ